MALAPLVVAAAVVMTLSMSALCLKIVSPANTTPFMPTQFYSDDPAMTLNGDRCGSWASICNATGAAEADVSSTWIQIQGVTTGRIGLVQRLYSSVANCHADRPYLSVTLNGTWMALGDTPLPHSGGFPVQIYSSSATGGYLVTTDDANTAGASSNVTEALNIACPCGGTWVSGTQRLLSFCPALSCKDTTWLGGTSGGGFNGITIGDPSFGWTQTTVGNQLTLSALDSSRAASANIDSDNTAYTAAFVAEDSCEPIVSEWGCSYNLG